MDLDLETVRTFVRVAELGSFTRAAEQLRVPKARVSQHVRRLEEDVGTRLLYRTTRTVRTTADGEQFLPRARRLVAEADELGTMFATARDLRGVVRVDLPVALAREVLIPRLPDLLAAHPRLSFQLSTTDRLVDVAREGFDCVLRVGALADSNLAVVRLGELAMRNCASPGYVRAHGKPRAVADLDDHFLVHYSASLGGDAPEFEYGAAGRYRTRRMRCLVTVNNSDAFHAACRAGLGIAQMPRYGTVGDVARGELVEVLPSARAAPLPVSLLHPHGGRVPRRVRVVLDWIGRTLAPYLEASA